MGVRRYGKGAFFLPEGRKGVWGWPPLRRMMVLWMIPGVAPGQGGRERDEREDCEGKGPGHLDQVAVGFCRVQGTRQPTTGGAVGGGHKHASCGRPDDALRRQMAAS